MRVLIIGCGYVGQPLTRFLASSGHEAVAIKRDVTGLPPMAGVSYEAIDITQPEQLERLKPGFDWVVNTVSSSRGGVEEYASVYLKGTENILNWCASQPPKKYVYTSSTSVYGQRDGSVVKESSPTEPESATSKILVDVEKLLLRRFQEIGFPAIILRVAGIYGPGRGHLFQQYLKDEARIVGDGNQIINMIHRDDLITGIASVLARGKPGEVYNFVDDEPVQQIHFFRWLSETLGKPMPPTVPAEAGTERKRGVTNKKVSNRKLKIELGYGFKYPTFRQGYTAEIQALE